MKTLRIAFGIALLLPACACVPLQSFYPLWDEQHLVFEPGLIGEWRSADSADDDGSLTFAQLEGNEYLIVLTDKDRVKGKKESRFHAHLVRLGEHRFLDFYADESSIEEALSEETCSSLLLMHFFARIRLEGDTLKLALLDDERFAEKVAREKIDVPLLKRGDTVILTADTLKIQSVLGRMAEDKDLWAENKDGETRFTRVRDKGVR